VKVLQLSRPRWEKLKHHSQKMIFVEPFGRDVLLPFSLSNRCPKKQQSQQHITAKADNVFADTSPNGALPNVAISQRPGQDGDAD